jgi:hypothetical protein
MEVFNTIRVLAATRGHPLFDPAARAEPATPEDPEFVCTGSGADGRGRYTTQGFVVLKGSSGRAQVVRSIEGTSRARLRQSLVE